MTIKCPACGQTTGGKDIDEKTGMAQCRKCGLVFSAAAQSAANAVYSPVLQEQAAPDAPAKSGKFSTAYDGADLVISWRWYRPATYFLLFFCLFWNGFLAVWYTAAIKGHAPFFFLLFSIIHLLVGLGLIYLTVAIFINRTDIRIGRDLLSVRHYPLPFIGQKKIPTADVEQLFCSENQIRSNNTTRTVYDVKVLLRDKSSKTLITGLDDARQARYIETEAEKFLRIDDSPVAGELPRV